ncbi:MAG: hypothetical protein O9325_07455 [Roseomonas sp.]|nr:hypothetical protein [Roseomonas sp.]
MDDPAAQAAPVRAGQPEEPSMNTVVPRPVDAVIAAARGFLGERISTNAAIREQHSRGEDSSTPTLPDAVAFVETRRRSRSCWSSATGMRCRWSPSAPARRSKAM